MEEKRDFMVHKISNASSSKREVYDNLTIEGGYYIPSTGLKNTDYISDILSSEKLA